LLLDLLQERFLQFRHECPPSPGLKAKNKEPPRAPRQNLLCPT
jgi:hypothetical protein